MRFDGLAIVMPNINIDTKYVAVTAEHLQQRCVINQRSAVCNSGFDYEVGPDLPDNFLHGDHVLRKLNYRPTHPVEIVRVLVTCNLAQPDARQRLHILIVLQTCDVFFNLGVETLCFIHFRHILSSRWCPK